MVGFYDANRGSHKAWLAVPDHRIIPFPILQPHPIFTRIHSFPLHYYPTLQPILHSLHQLHTVNPTQCSLGSTSSYSTTSLHYSPFYIHCTIFTQSTPPNFFSDRLHPTSSFPSVYTNFTRSAPPNFYSEPLPPTLLLAYSVGLTLQPILHSLHQLSTVSPTQCLHGPTPSYYTTTPFTSFCLPVPSI